MMEKDFQINTEYVWNRLFGLMREQRNLKNNNLYKDEIGSLTNLLNNLGYNLPTETCLELKDILNYDINLLDKYRTSYKLVRFFANSGLALDYPYIAHYKELNISDKDSVLLVYDFYHRFGDFFWSSLKNFEKDINTHLEFVDNTDFSESYFVDCYKEAFLAVVNSFDMCKLFFLVHELQHYIDNSKRMDFKKNYLIRETTSLFMEMISCDYFQNIFNCGRQGDKRRREIHSIIKANALDIYLKTQLLNIAKNNIELDEQSIINKISKSIHINEDGVNVLMKNSLDTDYFYEISYLIAIELYELYKYDSEKSIYILKKVITHGNDENIFDLLRSEDIIVSNSVIKYEKKLFN